MNENKLKRLFPHASREFIERNKDRADSAGMSGGRQQAETRASETRGDVKVEAQPSLRHVEIEFWAAHGKELDQDNRRYAAKPILDALVNLGFAGDDKNITSETTQRFNEDHSNL